MTEKSGRPTPAGAAHMDREQPLEGVETADNADEVGIKKIFERLFDRALKRIERNKKFALSDTKDTTKKDELEEFFGRETEEQREFFRAIAEELYNAEKEAETDPISGLAREPAFTKMYDHALGELKEDEQMMVIAFDLDNFRDINETIGHVAADEILREIGGILKKVTRPYDFCSRIGGDEFVVVLNKVRTDADLVVLAGRMAAQISKIVWGKEGGEKKHPITLSAGYSLVHHGDKPYFGSMRERADKLAGHSKKCGRNRLTEVKGDNYFVYKLESEEGQTEVADKGKHVVYELDRQGEIGEIEKDTAESCLNEVVSGLKRVEEEIRRFFDKKFKKFLLKDYQTEEFTELNLKQISGILLFVRTHKKQEADKEEV